MNLGEMQQALQNEGLGGWLFYDFRHSNPIAYQVLGLAPHAFSSRRWFYFVPAEGEPVALVSGVEAYVLQALPGRTLVFTTWQELQTCLAMVLTPGMRVAMEYSPLNAIPYIARVDAGTVELVRASGVEVVSSLHLSQSFLAPLSQKQRESHREAGRRLIVAKDLLFTQLREDLCRGTPLDEYRVQQRFVRLMQEQGLVVDHGPLVAVNGNASKHHYEPSASSHSPIQRGDLVLFDFWARLPGAGSIFADYTWMGFAGERKEIPAIQQEIFEVVCQARDAGVAFLRQRKMADEKVRGHEVDDVVRQVIANTGYGALFLHRTGHNIGPLVHGNGANLDNFETQDERLLLPFTCCSIEPGIYLPAFGIRSEINVLLDEREVEVTGGPVQKEIASFL